MGGGLGGLGGLGVVVAHKILETAQSPKVPFSFMDLDLGLAIYV